MAYFRLVSYLYGHRPFNFEIVPLQLHVMKIIFTIIIIYIHIYFIGSSTSLTYIITYPFLITSIIERYKQQVLK